MKWGRRVKGIYRKIEQRLWSDEKFRRLSPLEPSGQALWLFLLTGPHNTQIPGLFKAGRAALAEDLGWPLKAFDKAFREVFELGLAKADWKARLVWIPNAAKYNPPASPNVVRSWSDQMDLLPECELLAEAYQELKAFVFSGGEAFAEAFEEAIPEPFPKASAKPSGKASPKASGNQEQEQEQKQEQKQEDGMGAKAPSRPPSQATPNGAGGQDTIPGVDPGAPPEAIKIADQIAMVFDGHEAGIKALRQERGQRYVARKQTPKLKQKVRVALRDWRPEELAQAARNLVLSRHHRGENSDGVEFLGMDYVLREPERYLELCDLAHDDLDAFEGVLAQSLRTKPKNGKGRGGYSGRRVEATTLPAEDRARRARIRVHGEGT